MLISSEDPEIEHLKDLHARHLIDLNVMEAWKGHGPGIEQSCKFVFDYLDPKIRFESKGRCWVKSVRIWEHENNSAMLAIDD